jgi:hypothetical protein
VVYGLYEYCNVWGTPDDVEVDMGAAPVFRCIVLVVGMIPVVVGVCVVAGNDGSVALSSTLLGSTDKVLPEVSFIGILLVNENAAVLADPLCGWLLVLSAVALFGAMDVDPVHPIILLSGESEATVSANVEGGVSDDPSAIIAVITGIGVDDVFSLQISQGFSCGPSEHCSCRWICPATKIRGSSPGTVGCCAPSHASS